LPMLSEDDVNLRDMSAEELDAAWDLWFDLAQATNASDPPYSHGVFVNTMTSDRPARGRPVAVSATRPPGGATR
jgi:hypothetical protein